ncbi:MAG: hypothetical protein IRZ16_10385 [Myxococcaceae bacterium]|nr:hypothetical protein [Myxococcaceae bacterium]MBX5482226.1 hypothetical protein [Myxococcaceae bacterium]
MGFLGSIGNIVSKVLPKVTNVISEIASNPVGKIGIDILKQLAQSAFSKDGKGGLFSDSFSLTLPNPLSRLNGLLGNWGAKIDSVGDFLSRIGEFLQGKRQLEDGQKVDVPVLKDRAQVSAQQAASLAADIGAGAYKDVIASTSAASTASSSSASTASPASSGGSILGSISDQAFSTALTAEQNDLLSKVKDPTQRAQMEAQFKLQNYQNLMMFISNIMRIMGDISKSIVSNIR